MSIMELAACLGAVAFAVLVGFLVPVLIRLRNTATESEQLLTKMNEDLPALVSDLRSMSHNLSGLTDQARNSVEHASVLLHAVGEVGESVQQVHDVVRGSSGTLLTNVATLMAGVRAVTRVMRERYREEGEPHNGA
jgi:uncharacterized protein YoxC